MEQKWSQGVGFRVLRVCAVKNMEKNSILWFPIYSLEEIAEGFFFFRWVLFSGCGFIMVNIDLDTLRMW